MVHRTCANSALFSYKYAMQKIVQTTHIDDRLPAIVTPGKKWVGREFPKSGVFISALNAKFTTAGYSAEGAFAAYTTDEFTLEGEFVCIEMPGVRFAGTKIVQAPTGPGDLSYIDGCSNSVLIPPPRSGEPCLNYLYFPPGTDQSHHTHPSFRIGIILSGEGRANVGKDQISLSPGDVFILPRFEKHGFSTEGTHMSLIAFHPDSDDGPTDEHNPMKTRTYL